MVTPDLAVRIMREVIRRKQKWMPRIESYKAETYSRWVLEKVDEIAMMQEVVSVIYCDRVAAARSCSHCTLPATWKSRNTPPPSRASSISTKTTCPSSPGDRPDPSRRSRPLHFEVTGQRYLDKTIVYDISEPNRDRVEKPEGAQLPNWDDYGRSPVAARWHIGRQRRSPVSLRHLPVDPQPTLRRRPLLGAFLGAQLQGHPVRIPRPLGSGAQRRGTGSVATDPPKRGWRRRLQRLAIPPQSPYP